MGIIKNKKGVGEATSMTFGRIIVWIILAAFLMFIFFWYSGLGSKIITIFNTFLK